MDELHFGVLFTRRDMTAMATNPGDQLVLDGQRYLFGKLFEGHSLHWIPFSRYLPGSWMKKVDSTASRIHPKLIWPYWAIRSHRCNRLSECDYLINASGPLLYSGAHFHSLFEPWAILLCRILERGAMPAFINLAFGTDMPLPTGRNCASDGHLFDRIFCKRICAKAALTTCRDQFASRITQSAGFPSSLIACPSLMARKFHGLTRSDGGYIAVNFHPAGTRTLQSKGEHDARWVEEIRSFTKLLRRRKIPFRFVFHEAAELELAQRYVPDLPEDCMIPRTASEFLLAYGNARAAVTSRVHGAYAAASFGVPAVCVGSDTRLQMVELLDLPAFTIGTCTHEVLFDSLMMLVDQEIVFANRLLELCEAVEAAYMTELAVLLETGAATVQ